MAATAKPNAEAVETLLGIAEGLLADERTRGQNLDSKTASLAAFSGTILALDATLGQGLLRRELGGVGETLLPILFLIATGALVVAAGVAVVGVLSPQRFLALGTSEVKAFAEPPIIEEARLTIQGRLLRTLTEEVIPVERERNDKKARLTKRSAFCLAVGLVGIAGQAVTLGFHELGV